MKKSWVYFCLSVAFLQVGCSTGSSQVAASISPSVIALSLGQSIQFQATLPGAAQTYIWSVNGIQGGSSTLGTIDGSGDYTAPSGTQSIALTVTATSSSTSSSSVSAKVFVVAPGVVTPTQNPQVALYTIMPPASANVSVRFGLSTAYGLSTWTQGTSSSGGPVSIFVAGMVPNTVYHMEATVQFGGGVIFADSDHVFTTGTPLASTLPTLTAATTPGTTPQSGVELLDLGNSAGKVDTVVTDLSGNVLWTYDPGAAVPSGDGPNPIKMLPNGHFLINYSNGGADGSTSILQEVDLTGKVDWQMTAAQLNQALAAATCAGCNITVIGTHHDFAILPNDHLIVIAATQQVVSGTTVTGDVLIDLDQNHHPVWLWNEFDHLDINRHPYMYPDWTHTNAVIFSADDGNLIISIRHQNWLVKIDYNNGQGSGDILWHLGYQGDFTLLNADGSTDSDPTDWFYAEHGPSFATTNTTGNFSLVLFDNGDDRGVSILPGGTCGVAGQPACYSTVPILQLDESAMTATLAFNPKTPDYSLFGGNAEALENGNIEYDECSTTALRNSAAIYEVTQASPPQTIWQMQITGNYAYRGMRIPSLYPGVQW
ncbi:MAG: aryl-sulfate sulfotransferase [Candidatus Acidiferrales bacterium]